MALDTHPKIRVPQHSSDSDQSSSASGYNAHILPRVQTVLALAVVMVVQVRHSGTKGLDSSSRAIFSGIVVKGNRGWSWKALKNTISLERNVAV